MRNLFLFIFACLLFSCKKKNAAENLTDYNWVLKSQIIKPAITIDGKTSTNYLSLQNPEGCSKNFTYIFKEGGSFQFGSNGSLCDMIPNSKLQSWKKENDQITLDYGNGTTFSLAVKNNDLIRTEEITSNGKPYSLTSTYVAEKSK